MLVLEQSKFQRDCGDSGNSLLTFICTAFRSRRVPLLRNLLSPLSNAAFRCSAVFLFRLLDSTPFFLLLPSSLFDREPCSNEFWLTPRPPDSPLLRLLLLLLSTAFLLPLLLPALLALDSSPVEESLERRSSTKLGATAITTLDLRFSVFTILSSAGEVEGSSLVKMLKLKRWIETIYR